MKFEIGKPDASSAKKDTTYLWLDKDAEGDINLMAVAGEDANDLGQSAPTFYVLAINPDGTFTRAGYLHKGLGLKLNKYGEIQQRKERDESYDNS